jgi:excisionase family DNA binding protein
MDANETFKPLFVRITEGAKMLRMSRSSVYEGIRSGSIPAVRIAGQWRIPLAALQRLADETAGAPAKGADEVEKLIERNYRPAAPQRAR